MVLFRYCVSTIVRAVKDIDENEVILDDIDLEEDMIETEFGDLTRLYHGNRINFCDFSQFLLACGEQLHPCYHENVVEVRLFTRF